MRKLLVRDHEEYKSVSKAKFFDNGLKVLYKVTGMSLKDNKNYSDLYLYNFSSKISRKLTTDKKTSSYIKYDESTILVQRKDGQKTYINKIDINTGEESNFFTVDYNIDKLVMIDDTNYIFTAKYDTLFDKDEFSTEHYEDGTPKSKLNEDYYFFDDQKFRINGEGIVNGKRTRLYTYNIELGVAELISNPEMSVAAIDFKGDELIYTTIHTMNPMFDTMSIKAYNLKTKNLEILLDSGTYFIGSIYYLNEGVLFTGYDLRITHPRENAQMYALHNGKVKTIYNSNMDINRSGSSDVKLAVGDKSLKKGDRLYLTLCNNGIERIASIDIDGNIEYYSTGFDCISGFDIAENKIIMELMSDTSLQEIYLYENGGIQKLTDHNCISSRFSINPVEEFTYHSNGHEIKGYIIKPIDFIVDKKYPGILFIHGGPRGLYSKIYQHRMQVLANKGYFCFYTNPHGSASRGNEFSSIFGKHGETDYEDLMTFTNKVIEKYPQLDSNRLGVTGHSYGGIMTNHIITKTDRFKAAVSSASLSNFTTKAFGTDNGLGASMHVYGDPIENQRWTWDHSPLKNSKRVVTPTLFLHSDEDYRCLYIEAIQMYTALKRYGVETAMYLFKGEAHSLKKPRNKVKWLEVLLNWFERHLR